MAMNERATKGMKPSARDNRTIRIKDVKAVETRRKSSQKHSAVSSASAMRPSRKCTVSCSNLVIGLRVIGINRSLGSAASRQQSLHSDKSSQSYRSRQMNHISADGVLTEHWDVIEDSRRD